MRAAGGSRLPKSVSRRRPPQIRSMKIGSKTSGCVKEAGIVKSGRSVKSDSNLANRGSSRSLSVAISAAGRKTIAASAVQRLSDR